MLAMHGSAHPALIAILLFFYAITIAHHTKSQFHITAFGLIRLHMIYEHTGILSVPEGMPAVALDLVTPGAGDLFFLLVKQLQIFGKYLLFVRYGQYVC